MSLVTQITDLITRLGTEIKSMKSTYSGNSTGTITSLHTTDKTSLLAAINEIKDEVGGKEATLGFTPENAAKKGVVNGYAGLDGTGKVPMAQLPDVLNKNKGWYSTSAALIAAFTSASSGDYAIVGATDTVWIWDTDGTPSWKDGDTKGAVVSVNGQTGAVTLSFEAPITAGTTSTYFRGDKTFQDLFTQVRAATLTGLSTATNAVITATDTVLSSLGKLQKQVSDNLASFTSHTTTHPAPTVRDARNQVAGSYETAFSKNTAFNKNFGTASDDVCQGNDSRLSDARTPSAHTHTASAITDFAASVIATVLTGLSTATNAVISATDTVLSALGKLQKQISDNLTSFTSHTTTHPAPTVRDARNQVAGSYETAFSKNTAFNKNFGTAVSTVCQGNDSRLSDSRTPTAHTHTASQITDFSAAVQAIAYTEAEIGDITTNFVTAFNTAIA